MIQLYFHRYLYGMYSFGLEETNMYPKAEEIARKVVVVIISVDIKFVKLQNYNVFMRQNFLELLIFQQS